MLKRILCGVFAVMLVVIMAIPAFAAGTEDANEPLIYAGAMFDRIVDCSYYEDTAGTTIEWPFNYVTSQGGVVELTEDTGRMYFSAVIDGGLDYITGGFGMGYSDTFSLESDLFWSLPDVSFSFGSDDFSNVTRFQISYELVTIYHNGIGSSYQVHYKPVSYDSFGSAPLGYEFVDLMKYVRIAYFEQYGESLGADVVLLRNLKIKVYVECDGSLYLPVKISTVDRSTLDNAISSWVNSQKMYYTSGEFDATDWLVGTADSFLAFEFFPGFSVNTMFGLFLIISIVLWIIKLFS